MEVFLVLIGVCLIVYCGTKLIIVFQEQFKYFLFVMLFLIALLIFRDELREEKDNRRIEMKYEITKKKVIEL